MAIINKIGTELGLVAHYTIGSVFKAVFVHGYRYLDSFLLRNYDNDIKDVQRIGSGTSGCFAIFVYYEPKGHVSGSVSRILTALAEAGTQVILVSNHNLSDEQKNLFAKLCHTVIVRGNQGFDFGCYKDAVMWMRQTKIAPDRLLLLNDSNFYASRGLNEFVAGLLGDDDAIAAYENWGEGYHLQSFALSVSGRVFNAQAFEAFWQKYVPSNNRVLAIEMGEKKLSRVLLKVAETSKVLFPVARLYEKILSSSDDAAINPITVCQPWRNKVIEGLNKLDGSDPKQKMRRVARLCEHINITSPIHSGAFYFPRFLQSPIYKKDLVYRKRFAFWEVDAWADLLITPDERTEFGVSLRAKGDYTQLSLLDKIKYRYGLK